jgi:DMSO reductase family type II enzyme chaperone
MFTYSLTGLEIKSAADGPEEVEENETTARSAVYQVLGAFFSAPDRDHFDRAGQGLWTKELTEAASLLPFPLEVGELTLASDVDPESYSAEYARLFGAGCSEALQIGAEDRDDVEAKLRREYEYFGLAVSTDRRSADDLCTECDFMQYLAFREAATGSDRLRASYRKAQRDFLERHLLSWVPDMVAAATALGPNAVYSWGLDRLDTFLRSDLDYVTAQLDG